MSVLKQTLQDIVNQDSEQPEAVNGEQPEANDEESAEE